MTDTLAAEMGSILAVATASRRRQITEVLVNQSQMIVQTGPFAGMRLEPATSWGDLAPKLLGCYEAELHPVMEHVAATPYGTIVNVGCAEGYYAVGLALKLPSAEVHAFDTDTSAQQICRAAALTNGAANVVVRGLCGTEELSALLAKPGKPFVLMDCEGGERDLLDLRAVPELARADILVECHEFIHRGITGALIDAFRETHTLSMIGEGARDPNAYPALRSWGSLDRWLAVNEGRPETMHWLFMAAKG